jgi:hypothetical protein
VIVLVSVMLIVLVKVEGQQWLEDWSTVRRRALSLVEVFGLLARGPVRYRTHRDHQ